MGAKSSLAWIADCSPRHWKHWRPIDPKKPNSSVAALLGRHRVSHLAEYKLDNSQELNIVGGAITTIRRFVPLLQRSPGLRTTLGSWIASGLWRAGLQGAELRHNMSICMADPSFDKAGLQECKVFWQAKAKTLLLLAQESVESVVPGFLLDWTAKTCEKARLEPAAPWSLGSRFSRC